ncbi:MAG: aminotransferase class I/II-fold pyridoxal phosphate-dependent enzyme [Gemmatimonadetes bacterium]|nr:aminotransferase class I/II-fold pyridoxal phosphate-dependent enzyme [Gemmatimonadota bacterium]MYG22783.1 aminotransferase class I/II-fold pyridoxal phosphate-dependent enzyme [Gemmatimonadota bacterium]MYJ40743.1 aminotransferase class I/II-fold pyridoxal phosphate-dependent enzyme [Gemmatimonadota bacterium]
MLSPSRHGNRRRGRGVAHPGAAAPDRTRRPRPGAGRSWRCGTRQARRAAPRLPRTERHQPCSECGGVAPVTHLKHHGETNMTFDGPKHERPGTATDAVHAGQPVPRPGEPVVNPIVRSSTFHWSGPGDGIDLLYSRYGNNPNQRAVAGKIAALEGTEDALALASGMAAISMTLLAAAGSGDHVVASRHLYGATHALLTDELPRRGITTTFVDPHDASAWQAALTPRTRVVLIELPTNPTLRVFPVGPPREAARSAGALLAADMTFATPINIRAAEHGVDAVIHSATKYLGGHSDLIAGVVAGSAALIARIAKMMKLYGGSIDPQAAWLLERGIRTLPVRMERHNRTALALARWFSGIEGVRQVIHPGLPSHPDHECAARMLDGYGGMVSIVLEGGGEAADRFCSHLRLAAPAPSLGGVETLVSQPRHTSHVDLSSAERHALGIPDGFVRISVGLEDLEDLKADFSAAVAAAVPLATPLP